MIIIGYQGIGKSSLCKKNNNFIDLESSSFWIPAKEEIRVSDPDAVYRHDDWYEAYCNVAEDLSRQGYVVFVSSHEPVRKRLQSSKEIVVAIAPAPTSEMETIWIEKLKERLNSTNLQKDYMALKNAEERYKENITEIFEDTKIHVMIHDPNYNLGCIIEILTNVPFGWWRTRKEYVSYAAEVLSKSPRAISLQKWENMQRAEAGNRLLEKEKESSGN